MDSAMVVITRGETWDTVVLCDVVISPVFSFLYPVVGIYSGPVPICLSFSRGNYKILWTTIVLLVDVCWFHILRCSLNVVCVAHVEY